MNIAFRAIVLNADGCCRCGGWGWNIGVADAAQPLEKRWRGWSSHCERGTPTSTGFGVDLWGAFRICSLFSIPQDEKLSLSYAIFTNKVNKFVQLVFLKGASLQDGCISSTRRTLHLRSNTPETLDIKPIHKNYKKLSDLTVATEPIKSNNN